MTGNPMNPKNRNLGNRAATDRKPNSNATARKEAIEQTTIGPRRTGMVLGLLLVLGLMLMGCTFFYQPTDEENAADWCTREHGGDVIPQYNEQGERIGFICDLNYPRGVFTQNQPVCEVSP